MLGRTSAANRQRLVSLHPGRRPLVAHCHFGIAKLCQHTGHRDQVRDHLSTAAAMYRGMDMRFWLEQTGVEMKALA
jgi:hypothetical protein